METLFLVFGPASVFLGEMSIRDGAFVRFLATREGEEALGDDLQEWQTRGILTVHNILRDPSSGAIVERRVQPRQPDFGETFTQWADSRGFRVLSLPISAVPEWERILQRVPEADDRLHCIESLCGNVS